MVRSTNPGAAPPVLEVFRSAPDEIQVVYSSRRRLCALATGIIRGLAAHFQERVAIEEPSCMLRGDPFCSFVVHREHGDAAPAPAPPVATLVGDAGARLPAEPGIVIDEPTPRMLGDYRVLGLIGSGAMGRVYLAHDDRLDRRVAIKVMSSRSAGNAAARQRFIRESRSVGAIENPHVMTIHQVGEQDGVPYIVMQLLEGRTLRDHRDASGRLPLGEVLRIGREIAAGLAAAHRRGIVHRDIKPANVFLEGESRSVRIIDFGLARELDAHATALTHDGALVGTPSYMPPERIDDGDLDASSDLFGLGVILYELLADRLPFEGRSVAAVLTAIARGTPTPLAEIAPEVPREVGDLVMRLIAHDRAARPADARVVAEELDAFEKRFAG
jgi:serine/threonine protein kinase